MEEQLREGPDPRADPVSVHNDADIFTPHPPEMGPQEREQMDELQHPWRLAVEIPSLVPVSMEEGVRLALSALRPPMTATQQEAMKRLEKVRNATFVPKSFIYTVFHDLDTLFFRSVCRHRTYLTWSDMGRLCRDAAAFTMPILEGRGVAIRMAHKNLTTQWLPPPPPPRRPILPPELPFTLPPTWALEQAATEARHTGPTVLPALFYRALPPHLLNKPTFSRFDITAILLHEMIHAYLRIVCGTFDDALGDNGHGPSFVSILEALEDYLDPAFSMAVTQSWNLAPISVVPEDRALSRSLIPPWVTSRELTRNTKTQTNLETKATEAAAAEDEEEYEGGPKKKQKVEESTAETSLEHAKEILLAPWV